MQLEFIFGQLIVWFWNKSKNPEILEKNKSGAKCTLKFYLHTPSKVDHQKPVLHPQFSLSCTPPTT